MSRLFSSESELKLFKTVNPNSWKVACDMAARHETLQDKLNETLDSKELTKTAKELNRLEPVTELVTNIRSIVEEIDDLTEMIADDPDMSEMASKDKEALLDKLPQLEQDLVMELLPKDQDDDRNAILEVRAGIGGEEATLFCKELFDMYEKFARNQGWRFKPMEIGQSTASGYNKAHALVSGSNVFGVLKFEVGGHRVQRVPVTESGGRVHTSAVTVAVMPEAEEIDVQIDPKDLRVDAYRSSGPGGQSVNTTDSACRITHIPTGLVAQSQDERSLLQNKVNAMKVLTSRLYELKRRELLESQNALRSAQLTSGDRSERIRTYNWPQSRVTDHRIGMTRNGVDDMLSGGSLLKEFIDAMQEASQLELLKSLNEAK